MPDPTPFDDFERRLAEAVRDHTAGITDPRSTRLVAAEAMRVAGQRRRIVLWHRGRLLLLAAVLLLPLTLAIALVGAAIVRTTPSDDVLAVVLRETGDGLDVVLVRPDGQERALRHVTRESLGLGPEYALGGASLGSDGWLAVGVERPLEDDPFGRTVSYDDVLVDLAEPAAVPFVVHANGFTGPRWGPNGEFAIYCDYPPDCGTPIVPEPNIGSARSARLIDPDEGPSSERIVRDVSLHGGGPEIIWAADGSGFLYHFQTLGYGVTPLDGGQPIPGAPRIRSRAWRVEGSQLVRVVDLARTWYRDELAPATLLSAEAAAQGDDLWLLLEDRSGESRRAVLARMSGPGAIEAVHRLEVPAGSDLGFELAPDDGSVALFVGSGDRPDFMIAHLPEGGEVVPASPLIHGRLLGLVPASADAWPSR
jgi:hypothetical protein